MKKEVLCKPFPPELVRERPGQNGRTLHYIDVASVVARLNEGCDAWDFTIDRHEVLEGEVIVLGRLVADGVTKCAFGGSTITTNQSGAIVSIADDLKAAASDALKKAAWMLGVGLDLHTSPAAADAAARGNGRAPARRGPPTDDRATVRQLAAIHAASRRRGFSKDRLASYVAEQTGKAELSFLSRDEASVLIDSLSQGNGATQ